MGKVVIVTGASGGLGGPIATKFGLTGAKVVVNYARSAQDAEEVAKEINKGPGEAFTYKADVRNYQEVKGMVDATLSKWGRIDVLVNNAGGAPRWLGPAGKPVVEMEEEEWDTVIDINLKGTFLCIKAVAGQMMKQRDGHIINVGSGTGLAGRKNRSSYAAAKAGVIGLTKSVARELGDFNIRVNTVMPGLILHRNSSAPVETTQAFIKEQAVLHRTGTPEEFAEFIVYLAETRNISGQTLNLDSRILF